MWPHLLNELITVFEVKEEDIDKENTELTIEAIKLVELLSSLNIEDFQMNQWIFLIDGYGMKLESKSKQQSIKKNNNVSEMIKAKSAKQQQKIPEDNVEVFKTFIVKFIGDKEYSFYNINDQEENRDQMISHDQDQDMITLGRQPQSITTASATDNKTDILSTSKSITKDKNGNL